MKLYVGNLSFKTTEDALRAAFEQFGEVTSAQIVMDRETGRSRGFAFVEALTWDRAMLQVRCQVAQQGFAAVPVIQRRL